MKFCFMAVYVGMMFMGGGLGSWWGTLAYPLGGWSGIVALLMILSASICFLSWQEARGGIN